MHGTERDDKVGDCRVVHLGDGCDEELERFRRCIGQRSRRGSREKQRAKAPRLTQKGPKNGSRFPPLPLIPHSPVFRDPLPSVPLPGRLTCPSVMPPILRLRLALFPRFASTSTPSPSQNSKVQKAVESAQRVYQQGADAVRRVAGPMGERFGNALGGE